MQETNEVCTQNIDIENQFSESQQRLRKAMSDELKLYDTYQSCNQEEVLLSQAQKIMHVQTSYYQTFQGIENYRGTNLRGVSRNGRCNWQILSMSDGGKFYLATVDNILKAAILYDIFCIQTKGLKAKTNFNFTRLELRAVMQLKSLIKIKNGIMDQKQMGAKKAIHKSK